MRIEYHCEYVRIDKGEHDHRLTTRLNELGRNGWQLVSTSPLSCKSGPAFDIIALFFSRKPEETALLLENEDKQLKDTMEALQ